MEKDFLGETKLLLRGFTEDTRFLDEASFRARCAYWESQVAGLPSTEEHETALRFLYVVPSRYHIKIYTWEDTISSIPMVIELVMTPEGARFKHFVKKPDGELVMINADLRDASVIANIIAKNDDPSCPPLRQRLIQAIHHEVLEELFRRGNPASVAGRASNERIRKALGSTPSARNDHQVPALVQGSSLPALGSSLDDDSSFDDE